MALKGATDARIHYAIEARLRSDTAEAPAISGVSLEEHLRAAGGLLTPGIGIPLYRDMAHDKAQRPYIVYGKESPESEIEASRCGLPQVGYSNYNVVYVAVHKRLEDDLNTITVVDRIAALLDGYSLEVESQTVFFSRVRSIWAQDFSATETGVVHTGVGYRVQVD